MTSRAAGPGGWAAVPSIVVTDALLDERRNWTERLRRSDSEQAPFAGDAFERVSAAVLELEP